MLLDGDTERCSEIFRSVFEQTYKNIEYIFVHQESFDIEGFYDKIRERYKLPLGLACISVKTAPTISMMTEGIKQATGEVIFLKTVMPTLWYPNHILAHLQVHMLRKFKRTFSLSNVEYKAIEEPVESPFSSIKYRIGKRDIMANDLLLDEISFTKDVEVDFSKYITYIDAQDNVTTKENAVKEIYEQNRFIDHIISQIGSLEFTDEITIVNLVPTKSVQPINQVDWPNDSTIQRVVEDADGFPQIEHAIPTIFGNTQYDAIWNNKMRAAFKEHVESMKKRKMRIIVKRTTGMGDVIQTSSFISYLRYTYPTAEIWYVTGNSRSCENIVKTFATRPDKILVIEEHMLSMDMLGYNNLPALLEKNEIDRNTAFDLRIDLDLAYESRQGTPFAKAYYQTLGVEEKEPFYTLKPNLDIDAYWNDIVGSEVALTNITKQNELVGDKFISFCFNGSGWPSKELGIKEMKYILESFKKKMPGYKLVHLSEMDKRFEELNSYFDFINSENDFNLLLALCQKSSGYVSADNGIMHIMYALDIPMLIWSGAALTEVTLGKNEDSLLTIIKKDDLPCLGCKHKMFYNIIQIQQPDGNIVPSLTFLPNCTNAKPFECMNDYKNEYLDNKIDTFIGSFSVQG